MRIDEIDENAKITLTYKDYEELKETLNLCKHWLWKLRNHEELTDEENAILGYSGRYELEGGK